MAVQHPNLTDGMSPCDAHDPSRAAREAVALSSGEVFPPDPSVAVLGGALSVGSPSYEAVLAEHAPQMPGGASCRSCGFVYAGQPACPAVLLAKAGYPVLADRVRMAPAADPEYGALCELTVAVERLDARLNIIGARVATETPARKRRPARRWMRLLDPRK